MPPQDNSFNIANFAEEAGINAGERPGLELGVTARNLIPSLKKNLGDIVAAVTSPIDTAKGLLGVAGGYASKAGVPGLSDYAPYADAMNQMIVDRYGGVENLMDTIETDPVGVLMDFSGISGVGGKLAKMSGFENAGDLITAAGNAVDPINQGINVAGSTIGAAIPRNFPENVYASGAKLGTTLDPKDRSTYLRTAVEEGIMPNDAGLAKLARLQSELRTQIDNLIDQASESGSAVDATVLFDSLNEMRKSINEGMSADKLGDLEQIAKVENKLMQSIYGEEAADWGVTVPKPLTARQLQDIKYDVYQRGYRSSRQDKPPLREQAYQAIGRDARRNVEALSGPQVAPLNQRLGNLLEMQRPLERASNRIYQRNLFSLPQTIGASSGVASGDLATGLLGYGLGSIITPENQARLGIGLERLRQMPRNPMQTITSAAPGRGLLRTGAYSGRAQQGLRNRGLLR